MNRKLFLIILSILFVSLIVSVKFYFEEKNKFKEEYEYYLKLDKKIKEILFLKKKYELNKYKLNLLKKYCNISENSNKYLIECKNLDEKSFDFVQKILFRNNFKIDNFEIDKNINISLTAGIDK
jgi:hypothetical protein